MKKFIMIIICIVAAVAIGKIFIGRPTNFMKCGQMTGRTVDIEKQEIRYKFADCKKEFTITQADLVGQTNEEKSKHAEDKIFTATELLEHVDLDENGNIVNAGSRP